MNNTETPILIIGMGNEFRGDDSVGVHIANGLAQMQLPGVRIISGPDDGLSLLDLWHGVQRSYLFDAVSNGRSPGMIYRIDARHETLPTGLFNCSTHAFGLAEAVELGRMLKRLPPRLIVYGIEGQCFDRGAAPSPPVLQAAQEVIREVATEITGMQPEEACYA